MQKVITLYNVTRTILTSFYSLSGRCSSERLIAQGTTFILKSPQLLLALDRFYESLVIRSCISVLSVDCGWCGRRICNQIADNSMCEVIAVTWFSRSPEWKLDFVKFHLSFEVNSRANICILRNSLTDIKLFPWQQLIQTMSHFVEEKVWMATFIRTEVLLVSPTVGDITSSPAE